MIGKHADIAKAAVSHHWMTSLRVITTRSNAPRVREQVGFSCVEFLNTCGEGAMRRKARERKARRQTYLASKQNYWTPNGLTLEDYWKTVIQHPPIAEILEYLEKNPRDWQIHGEEFEFAQSKDGVCEKCAVRELEHDLSSELKVATNCFNGTAEVQFSRYAADHFATGKQPIILTPNLHRDFVYQSWVEAAHLEHIKQHRDEPGILATFAHPEIGADGKLSLGFSIRAVDGSHRAALTYREGRPFAVRVLTPVETLKSIFSIDNKKNPFFALKYSPEVDDILERMARGEVGPHVPFDVNTAG